MQPVLAGELPAIDTRPAVVPCALVCEPYLQHKQGITACVHRLEATAARKQ
jgi:hypothetical protein